MHGQADYVMHEFVATLIAEPSEDNDCRPLQCTSF